MALIFSYFFFYCQTLFAAHICCMHLLLDCTSCANKYWIYIYIQNACDAFSVQCVSKTSPILSIMSVSNTQGLVFLAYPLLLLIVRRLVHVYHIINIKSGIRTISHCLGLDHETIIYAVCFAMFLCDWKQLWGKIILEKRNKEIMDI